MSVLRKASGLRREWSQWDVFNWNFLTTGVFAAGGFLTLFLFPLVTPHANLLLATMIAGGFTLPIVACFALMGTSWPRSGADYVYVSRCINPALGFALTAVPWVLFGSGFLAFAAREVANIFLPGPAFLLGATGFANFLSSTSGQVMFGLIFIFVPLAMVSRGMKFIAMLVRPLFAIQVVVILVFFGYMAVSGSFVGGYNSLFGSGTYETIIANASPKFPVTGGYSMSDTFILGAYIATSLLYGMGAVAHLGESKNIQKVKQTLVSFVGATLMGVVVYAVMFTLFLRFVGQEFWSSFIWLMATHSLGSLGPAGFPFFLNFIPMGSGSALGLLVAIVIIAAITQILFLQMWNFYNPTKYIFAQAYDGLLPSKLASVSTRYAIPVYALVSLTVIGLIWFALGVASPSLSITNTYAANIFGYLLVWTATPIALILFPFRQKRVFEASPISKFKNAVIGLGIVSTLLGLVLIYVFVTQPGLGASSAPGEGIVAGTFVAALVLYFVLKYVRRTQGIDIALAYKELPPE